MGWGLASYSQTVGSLLRTPWPVELARKMNLLKKWIQESHNKGNHVLTKIDVCV
jgi:hypothetical protein